MKMKSDLFNTLTAMVQGSSKYGELMEYRAKGLSDMRYRWDCLWSVPDDWRKEFFDQAYAYLNDDHIDTALRKITGTN